MNGTNVFKICLWRNSKPHTYIFTGEVSKDIEEVLSLGSSVDADTSLQMLRDAFGAKYKTILDINKADTTYIFKSINNDDNMNIICKKLLVYLQPYINVKNAEDIYLWTYKPVLKNEHIELSFISQVFKSESKVRFDYFKHCLANYFALSPINDDTYNMIDKYSAFKLLRTIDYQYIIEPLLFKWVSEGYFEHVQYDPLKFDGKEDVSSFKTNSHTSLTLSYFDIGGSVIHMITTDDVPSNAKHVYFPFHKSTKEDFASVSAFIKQLDSLEHDINSYQLQHAYKLNTYVTFFYLKGNEINLNPKLNLSMLFDKYHATKTVPFIKFKTNNNIFYKIDKESITTIQQKDLDNWTLYKPLHGKLASISFVTFKLLFGKHSYCTFTLSDTLTYDIKFNIGVDEHIKMPTVHKFFDVLNTIIEDVKLLYPDAMLPLISVEELKIVNLVTYNTIGLDKTTVKYDNIDKIITTKMYPYFNIIPNPDKNILHLQYKKVDNYVKFDNIQSYITLHFGLPKDVMVAKLMETYVLSKQEAETEYEKWSSKNQVEFLQTNNDSVKIKPKSDNFVNVKLKLNETIDTKFVITGLKDYGMMERITRLVQVILDMTNQKVKKTTIDIEKFDDQMFHEEKDDALHFDEFNAEEVQVNPEFDFEEENQEDLEALLALEQKYATDDVLTKTNVPNNVVKEPESQNETKIKKKGKAPGYVLGLLREADPDLFNYDVPKTKKRQDYPSICGWSDTRQPIVISQDEKDNIDTNHPSSYDDYIKVGSRKDLAEKNIYICPKIWCPKSRVSMTYKEYIDVVNKRKAESNNQDVFGCPFEDEEAIMFDGQNFWGKEQEKALTRGHYVGFLKSATHPKKFCLPCCYKNPMSTNTKKGNNDEKDKCITNLENATVKPKKVNVSQDEGTVKDDIVGNEKYIKGEYYFPLENSRYGLLAKEISDAFGGGKCGNRHDGTGLMENGTSCFLRKGISHGENSFVSSVYSILNANNKSPQALLNSISKNLNIEQYLALENGKIIRLFINPLFDINNPAHFKEFKVWFLTQQKYIEKYNLYKVKKELGDDDKVFDKTNYYTYKDIIREFMIYNSYTHFLKYLHDSSMVKDHRTLLDLFNTEHSFINPEYKHFVLIDVDPKTNKATILCPFNRNVQNTINLHNPFVFIVKTGTYYEPLCHVVFANGDIQSKFEFEYETMNDNMKKIVQFYMHNCGQSVERESSGESIAVFLESLGYKIRSYVLDFSFRIRGLILQNNLYIPFVNKMDLYNVVNKSYVYYNDIIDFKCLLDKTEVRNIFKKIASFTKEEEFYKVTSFVKGEDKIVALILNDDVVVPLRLNKTTALFRMFENDLEIFIEHQEDDKRTQVMKLIKENTQMFEVFFQHVTTFINSNDQLRQEIEFLTSKQNPFPKNYKRHKLMQLLQNIAEKVVIQADSESSKSVISHVCATNGENCIYPCNVDENNSWDKCLMGIPKEHLEKFVNRMIESMLIGTSKGTLSKIFVAVPTEFLLDQHDINNNRINELIDYQRNPFKLLSEKLEDVTDSYVHDKTITVRSLTRIYITPQTEFSNVRVIWEKKGMKDFEIVSVIKSYNSLYLYSLFVNVNDVINQNKSLDVDTLKSIVLTQIKSDFKHDRIDKLFENKSFQKVIAEQYGIKNIGNVKPSLDICLTVAASLNYYPSMYELNILADVVGVNVVVIGRVSNTKNPDGFEYIDKKANYTLILDRQYDRVLKRDVVQLYVRNRKILLFRKHEIPIDLQRVIHNKSKVFVIEVNSD